MEKKPKRRYKTKRRTAAKKQDDASFNLTLNDSYWMDSFDKLVQNEKPPLREKNLLKCDIRSEFNRDSSFENSQLNGENKENGDISTPLRLRTLKVPSQMFFNFISTPASKGATDKSLNLDVIVSSEGENSSVWKQISFPNASMHLLKKRTTDEVQPVGKKILKTPVKEAPRITGGKPRVVFQLDDDTTTSDGDDDVIIVEPPRKSVNFVLKPGKWRKSMVNLRRTNQLINADDDSIAGIKSDRTSFFPKAGRQRKSIYIPIEEDEESDPSIVCFTKQSDVHDLLGLPCSTAKPVKVEPLPRPTNDAHYEPEEGGTSDDNDEDESILITRFTALNASRGNNGDHQVPSQELRIRSKSFALNESTAAAVPEQQNCCNRRQFCIGEGEEDESETDDDDEDSSGRRHESDESVSLRIVGSKFARQLSKSHCVSLINDDTDGGDIYRLAERREDSDEEEVVVDGRKEAVVAVTKNHNNNNKVTSNDKLCLVDGSLSVRETVLRYCDQSEPLSFADVYSEGRLSQCRKVGEGVYSEVFMYRRPETGKAVVLKVIPIEGTTIVNGEVQKKFDEILSEIIISKELSDLRYDSRHQTNGFVGVERVCCVQGEYPEHLIDLWELYRDNHGSDNDHPAEVFDSSQLFIVLELENAGQDLEAFNFTNAVQGYSAFVQTALTLAVAESKYEFEHRDLHWGNILLSNTDAVEAVFVLNGRRITVPTAGIKVTIIDYTLSRMLYKRAYLQFNDLAHDEDLFSATGDYQFEIYRLMRKRLDNVWSAFDPYTNVLWLHYALDKMINGARYRLKQSKKHKNAIREMIKLLDNVLDFKSAAELAKLFFGPEDGQHQ